ncbi:hypothetical protein BDFB_013708 [Asbolus verrucosus]|uniref:Uncharacterized protein n=1 Tax=Asbolus verrucosus TaxID=1661398 RepID=A0A482V0Z7_ASBVE|nr:hypothetical protein BDFB_013708 [Asbolus verrucosus]
MKNGLILRKLALKNFSCLDKKKGTVRPKKRAQEVVGKVWVFMEATPSKSTRKLLQQIHLSYGTSQEKRP